MQLTIHGAWLPIVVVLWYIRGTVGEDDWGDVNDLYNQGMDVRLVQALFRHGDRSPTRTYANDIYTESDWPQGFGQLSIVGMQQEYQLGQYMKQVYIDQLKLLSENYVRTELYVRSSSLNRALMSASSVLAGLFPPGPDAWNKTIGWQPIPIHTVPEIEDNLLLSNTPCPVVENIVNQSLQNNPFITKIMQQHSHFYQYVSKHSGEPNTWQGIYTILDPIFCQAMSSDKKLPEWVTDDIFNELLQLRDLYTQTWFPSGTEFLRGGPLLKEMIEHMVNRSTNVETQTQKVFLYSAHDSTVVALLSAMGLFNDRQPPYTACVIVELLHQTSNFYVRVLYKNETHGSPHVFTLEKCDHQEFCPLDNFTSIFQANLPVDFEQECGIREGSWAFLNHPSTVGMLILNIVLAFGILWGLINLIVGLYKHRDRERDSHDYMQVPTEMSELG